MANQIIPDGYSSTITFATFPEVAFKEKELTPPALVMGQIDVTTMHSVTWRQKFPKSLKELGEVTANVAWDPTFYDEVLDAIGVIDTIRFNFPDGTYCLFSGWLDEFKPGRVVEGQQPMAEIKIIPSISDGQVGDTIVLHFPGG